MKNRNKVYDSLILIMQFGINMIVPIFLCVGLGVFIYRRYGHLICTQNPGHIFTN